jgi:KaiC/GvpD/RAD55 family RecA-like ATPase
MTTIPTHQDHLETGIESLDDQLGGGLIPGSSVAVLADSTSQSEILIAALAAERPALYLTAQRSAESVRRSLSRLPVPIDATVRKLGDDPLEMALTQIDRLDSPTTVVIDPVNGIDESDAAFAEFLNEAGERLTKSAGLLVLHCVGSESDQPTRLITTYMADVVFDLETDYSGDMIENYLVVPKVRGGRPVPHSIKLEISDVVRVDTSRDIS